MRGTLINLNLELLGRFGDLLSFASLASLRHIENFSRAMAFIAWTS